MRILFLILLLSFYSFSQENRLVRQNELSDSLDAVRTLIGTGGVALPDSVIYTSELTPYVDKSSTQTITGQKNFMGTVKIASDTSMSLGILDGGVNNAITINELAGHPYGRNRIFRVNPLNPYTGSWQLRTSANDWVVGDLGLDHILTLGYNLDNEVDKPGFGHQYESDYEVNDSLTVYESFEWFGGWGVDSYAIRPFQLGIYQYGLDSPYVYTSSVGVATDLFWINNELGNSLIEFRTQTYGSSKTVAGGDGGGTLGNSLMFIVDSLWIYHSINNFGWLYQLDPSGSARELMRLDNTGTYGNVVIAPSGVTPISLYSPIYGQIKWTDEAGTGTIPIYKEDNTNKLILGGSDGIAVNLLEIRSLPLDSSGITSGGLYADPVTGQVLYGLPTNIITNGEFTSFTDSVPNNWTYTGDGTNSYVEESPTGKLHFASDGTEGVIASDATIDSGVTYGYSFTIDSLKSASAVIYVAGGGYTYSSAGRYSGTYTALNDGSAFSIVCGNPCDGDSTDITIDNVKVWVVGGERQNPITPHQTPITINGVTITDTVFIGRMETGAIFDSIRVFDVQDSIAIQLFYRNPTDNDLITTVDTLTADTTIAFDTTTIPAGAKVYMYPVYIGDSEAYLRSEIYWREK